MQAQQEDLSTRVMLVYDRERNVKDTAAQAVNKPSISRRLIAIRSRVRGLSDTGTIHESKNVTR